jgi:ElaB/YqjD/DUF883 family membrane-anchored ribosome-binding protein
MSAESSFTAQTPRDPDAIERQNDAIRADMDRTLHALERKLSPGQLLDQALQMVKGHGGEMAFNLGNTVKQNPMPALLTAVGIAWMMSTQRQGQGESRSVAQDRDEDWTSQAGEATAEMGSRLREAAQRTGEKAAAARERLGERIESVKQSARSAATQTRVASQRVQRLYDEQPLAIGAIAVGVGALLGSLVPETRAEHRMLGEVKDRAADRAREFGEREYEKLRDTLKRAAQADEGRQTQH